MTLTLELDLDRVTVNQHVKYPHQRLFHWNVIVQTNTYVMCNTNRMRVSMTECQSCGSDPEVLSEADQSVLHLTTFPSPLTHHCYQPQPALLSDSNNDKHMYISRPTSTCHSIRQPIA